MIRRRRRHYRLHAVKQGGLRHEREFRTRLRRVNRRLDRVINELASLAEEMDEEGHNAAREVQRAWDLAERVASQVLRAIRKMKGWAGRE